MDNGVVKRLTYIDLAKGIGILCIVIGHSYSYHIGNGSILIPYLYSFHVPIFFIASGIIYSRRINRRIDFVKKCRQLIVPYLIWGTLYQATLLCFSALGGTSIGDQIGSRIKSILCLTSGAMWFLPTMFVASILFLFSCHIQKAWIRLLLCAISFVIGAFVPQNLVAAEALWRGLIGFSFMTLGFYGAKLFTRNVKMWQWMIFFAIDIALININDTCDLARRSFGILPLYILISFIGSWLCITGCRYFERKHSNHFSQGIEKIGRFSIIVLCLHQIILAILQLMDYKLLGYTIQKTGELEGIIMAVLIIAVIYLITPILLRYAGWSFGIQKSDRIGRERLC